MADMDGTDQKETESKEECGWCKWMKAGGCSKEFTVWLDCVDAVRNAGSDEDVASCSSVMGPLWECMQKNVDYYAPQLSALEAGKRPAGSSSGEGTADPPTGESGGSASPAAAAAAGAEAVDFDNLTDKDIEAYLERIDREEGGGLK